LTLGLVAAAVFGIAAAPNLTGQGLYYDELHQATGSFAYLDLAPEMFSIGSVFGLPVLNTSYSGAMKTGIFGVWLRLSGKPFTVRGWRLLGILLAAAGLGVFVWLARPRIGNLPCFLFVFLVSTDATVLLACRHDWGPVALALALRLLFLGVWLYGSDTDGRHPSSVRNSTVLGLIVGFALFEKLSSIVLLVPLILIVSSRHQPTRKHHFLTSGAGLFVGALPLVLANIGSLAQRGTLISLSQIGATADRSAPLGELFFHYLDLARGIDIQNFILGRHLPSVSWPGLVLVVAALSVTGLLATVMRRDDPAFSRSLAMLGSYLGVAAALHLLPNRTWVHHWVLGTPFQYLAFALVVTGMSRARPSITGRRLVVAIAVIVALAGVVVMRVPQMAALEGALLRGETSRSWHPSLTELGTFAAHRGRQALFLASDWGVATQIYCLAQGQPLVVREMYWDYTGPGMIEEALEQSKKDIFYLVRTEPPARVRSDNSQRIEEDVSELAGWVEIPPEPETGAFETLHVRKFMRRR
jgi:hypothetical protein